jgi:hypothetical protein
VLSSVAEGNWHDGAADAVLTFNHDFPSHSGWPSRRHQKVVPMTARTDQAKVASPQSDNVASPVLKNRVRLKHSASRIHATNNARRRVGLPVRDWQAGFQSHV